MAFTIVTFMLILSESNTNISSTPSQQREAILDKKFTNLAAHCQLNSIVD